MYAHHYITPDVNIALPFWFNKPARDGWFPRVWHFLAGSILWLYGLCLVGLYVCCRSRADIWFWFRRHSLVSSYAIHRLRFTCVATARVFFCIGSTCGFTRGLATTPLPRHHVCSRFGSVTPLSPRLAPVLLRSSSSYLARDYPLVGGSLCYSSIAAGTLPTLTSLCRRPLPYHQPPPAYNPPCITSCDYTLNKLALNIATRCVGRQDKAAHEDGTSVDMAARRLLPDAACGGLPDAARNDSLNIIFFAYTWTCAG